MLVSIGFSRDEKTCLMDGAVGLHLLLGMEAPLYNDVKHFRQGKGR